MHTKENAPFLQLFPNKHPLPHPLYNTPPPPMNSLRTLLYKFPPWVTGISHDDSNEVLQSISQMIKVCWDSQKAPPGQCPVPVVMHYWKGLFRTYTTTIML